MGHVLNYTLGDVVSHVRRRRGYQVLRPMGYDAFGLPAENAAIQRGRPPARRSPSATSRDPRRRCSGMGWAIDWDREVSTHEPDYYRWTQWLFLQLLRARPRLPQGGAGQLVPERPDGARERAGDRRPLRALRRRGRGAEPRAVVLQDHRLRRRAARRDGPARAVARARADDAAQLDRPLRGRASPLPHRRSRRGPAGLHDPARHAVRRDVLRARAGAPARPAARRGHEHETRCASTCATRRRARRSSARRRRRRRLHRPLRGQPGQRRARSRSGSPTTC